MASKASGSKMESHGIEETGSGLAEQSPSLLSLPVSDIVLQVALSTAISAVSIAVASIAIRSAIQNLTTTKRRDSLEGRKPKVS